MLFAIMTAVHCIGNWEKKTAELGNFYAIEWLKKNNSVMQE